MNAIVERPPTDIVKDAGRLSAQDVVQHVRVVQEVMQAVMREGLHYGNIPGTDKPSLLQPGADVLAMTFRIAPKILTEDLSTADHVRYRVTVAGVHQLSGMVLGEGVGECSSGEEKYKWRRAVSKEEFDATPANLRRVKFGKSYKTDQVRTEPADVANTVLKMAVKRAKIAMILNVTGASDMFGQDLEDLDATLRESLTESDGGRPAGPTLAQQAVRNEALAAVKQAKTKEDLRPLGKRFTPQFKENGDRAGYDLFAEAVKARANELPAAEPETNDAPVAAPAPAADPATGEVAPPAADDPWIKELEASQAAMVRKLDDVL